MPVVYKPTTPEALYKNNFAPNTPGSPASACPFAFKSATTLPLIDPKHGVAFVATVIERVGVGVVGEIVSEDEIDSVALTVNVGSIVGVAKTVAVGNSVETTTGASVGALLGSTATVGVMVNSVCAPATWTLANGVAVSFVGRIVVSIGGR